MPDDVVAAGEGTPASGEPSPVPTGGDANPAYVTEEALTGMLQKMTSDVLAQVGRQVKDLKSSITPPEPEKGKKDLKDKASPSSADQTLRERLTLLEERDTKQKAKALRLSLRDALVNNGADPRLAELTVPALLEAERDHFSVGENTFGDYEAKYQDESVATWAEAFMQGDDGKRIRSANPAPNLDLPRGEGTPRGMKEVRMSEISSVSDEELESGLVRIVPG